jgi:Kef-type K+ transport system membrane component KefB
MGSSLKKSLWIYTLIVGVFLFVMWLILVKGNELTAQHVTSQAASSATDQSIWKHFIHNVRHPLSMLLLQIIIIFLSARLFGFFAKKIGQQSVIGEIIAGIVLGPSLMGWLFPDFSLAVFPKESLKGLQFLSQIGLTFFMFIIGMEFDTAKLKNKAHDAVVISHSSIVFPYFLGMVLAYFIYRDYAPANVGFLTFALFMGISMSITAFPVLARILHERKLMKTPLGVLAITCAAADDVTAWCILAAVVAIANATSLYATLITIGLTVGFVAFMLLILKPRLNQLSQKYVRDGKLGKTMVAIFILVLLVSSYVAEIIGIHALFGAFLAGVIMPNNFSVKEALAEKVEDVSVLLLLPIFFAITGLRTQIGLLNQGHLWLLCGVVIAVAVLGKFGGSSVAARMVGHSWKDALSIGALMNTRGLMELVVLNIGYDLGILSPEIFAIMVLMALATTFMTSPCLDLINHLSKEKTAAKPASI